MSKIGIDELKTLIKEEVTAAVTAALPGQAGKAQEPEPDGTKPEGDPADREGKSARPAEDLQRKYSSIYMSTGAEPPQKETRQEKGIGWARAIKCVSQSQGDPERAVSIARKMYSQDDVLHRELKAMSATAPTDGGYLIPEMYAADVIELLYDQCVVTKLGAVTVPMPNGNLTIPKLTSGASAGYIGELRKPKESQATIGNIKLSGKKLATKVIISNDLLRSASYRADQIIRDDALRAMALAMDKAAIMGRGSEYEPKGLLNMNITKLAIDAAPDSATTGKMLAELIKANVSANKLGWAINGAVWGALYNVVDESGRYVYREGMDQGKLNGHAFEITNQLPIGADANGKCSMLLGNWADFLIGEQLQMEAEMFREATIIDNNKEIVSAVDNDCSILRLISIHDFGVRHEQSFVLATGIKTK